MTLYSATSTVARGESSIAGQVRGFVLDSLPVVGILLQFVLVAWTIRQVDLFTSGFRRVLYVALVGFVIHHFLPVRFKSRAFALVCISALLVLLGGSPRVYWDGIQSFQLSAPILLAVCGLAAICVSPYSFWTRAALLAAVGALVALFRAGWLGADAIVPAWPVLAGFVMFRAVTYLYEVSTAQRRPSLSDAVGYFLLFPNSALGLFPVVSFNTFVRSRVTADAISVYQRGLAWMTRGVLQLLFYRWVQQIVAITPGDVSNGTELARFVLSNTLIYVNVSGQFHLVIGLLLLFGFNLPESNRRYLLASSFTDYWRRVNVYWKDFILSVFYYPSYFRFKQYGTTIALVIATLWSFFVTWALHLYQTWWLTGSAEITLPDVLFWSSLAVLVLMNSLWEIRRGRQRRLSGGSLDLRETSGLVIKTVCTFFCISLLWSLWSTPTLSQWIRIWGFFDRNTLLWALIAATCVACSTVLFEVLPGKLSRMAAFNAPGRGLGATSRYALTHCVMPLLLVCGVTMPSPQARVSSPTLQAWIDAVSIGDSAIEGAAVENAGYYERLLQTDSANARLGEILTRRVAVHTGANPVSHRDGWRFNGLVPSVRMNAYFTEISTNRWGMRDRDYPLQKRDGIIRIVVLGSSNAMGWGVRQENVFDQLVEDRLNATEGALRFEVLNFSMPGRGLLGQIDALRYEVARFAPDVVILVTHTVDYSWISRDLTRAVREGIPVREQTLRDALRGALVTEKAHPTGAARRLKAFEPDLLRWTYTRIAEDIRTLGALPIAVFLPYPDELPMDSRRAAQQTALVRASGFILVDFAHLFDGQSPASVMLAEPMHHFNEKAHAKIAEGLYDRLIQDPQIAILTPNRTRAATGTVASLTNR